MPWPHDAQWQPSEMEVRSKKATNISHHIASFHLPELGLDDIKDNIYEGVYDGQLVWLQQQKNLNTFDHMRLTELIAYEYLRRCKGDLEFAPYVLSSMDLYHACEARDEAYFRYYNMRGPLFLLDFTFAFGKWGVPNQKALATMSSLLKGRRIQGNATFLDSNAGELTRDMILHQWGDTLLWLLDACVLQTVEPITE